MSLMGTLGRKLREPRSPSDVLACLRSYDVSPASRSRRGVVARTHSKGKAQRCWVQGNVTTTAITRKPQSRAAHRSLAAGEGAVAVMPTFADIGLRAPFQRFVDHDIDAASCLDKALHEE
jgi:hypothetical protein